VKQEYVEKRFNRKSNRMIETAEQIIQKYQSIDLRLTLRQLYYQFVAHHGLPNTEKSYKNLGRLISDARLAGRIDWNAIEDRGRVPDSPPDWDSAEEVVEAALHQFRLPRRADQDAYVELWVEKQALAGVLEPVARRHHITLMVNKGYSSQSAMYESAQRYLRHKDKTPVLLYLGDHDPSGEDMVRDIGARLRTFRVDFIEVTKVALTMAQVKQHNPPPNPAKLSDSRASKYIRKHGASSWEVDALDPETLVALIEKEILAHTQVRRFLNVIKEEKLQVANVRKALGL